MSWLFENDESTLVEELEDILDGMETIMEAIERLMDVTEIIHTKIVERGLATERVAPVVKRA